MRNIVCREDRGKCLRIPGLVGAGPVAWAVGIGESEGAMMWAWQSTAMVGHSSSVGRPLAHLPFPFGVLSVPTALLFSLASLG